MIIKKINKSSDPIFAATNIITAIDNPVFPLDIEELALNVGIQEIQDMDTDKFEGMLVALPDKTAGYINISSNIRELTRRRFTIAHELGHFLITSHVNNYECSSYDTNNYLDTTKPQEIEANKFAAELLMPEYYFKKEIQMRDPSYDLFQLLTDKFGSSLTSTLIRYKDFTDESIAIVKSENAVIQWVLKSEEFKYFIESDVELSPDSYAIEYFQGNDLPKEFDEVEQDTWFETSIFRHHLLVKELSIPMPYYNQVLSVIWIEEDEDEIEDHEDEFDGYLKLKES